jgi:acetate---CoA ligase (ADP-forming)
MSEPRTVEGFADLGPVLRARTVAVVGASAEPSRPGSKALANLLRLRDPATVFAVNPKYDRIGEVVCVPDLASLPQPADLALVAVPARAVIDTVRSAGAAGVRGVVVFSSGFAETGPAGVRLQAELVEAARGYGTTLVGPNTSGVIDLHSGLLATFTSAVDNVPEQRAGGVAVVSQSGAVGAAVHSALQLNGAGCLGFAASGNEALLDVADFVHHYALRDDVTGILGYIEGGIDGHRLLAACRTAREQGKAVALLKVGTTDVGRQMALSHTGSLAGDHRVFASAAREAGVVVASDLQELVDIGTGVSARFDQAGPRLGIVSLSGGAAVMAADRAGRGVLEVPTLSAPTLAALGDLLPDYSARTNPVDLGGIASDAERIVASVEAVAADPEIDQVLVSMGTSPSMVARLPGELARIREQSRKPMVVSWIGGPATTLPALRAAGLPAFDDPYAAVGYAAVQAAPSPRHPPASPATTPAQRAAWRAAANERSTASLLAVLDAYGVARDEWLDDQAEPPVGQSYAVKADAPGLVHKSDIGAVLLDVGALEVQAARAQVTAAARAAGFEPTGTWVQPMVSSGHELILGVHRDPVFGPVVLVGTGGVHTEVIDDCVLGLPPLTAADARALLSRLRGYPLLAGHRGPGHDVEAVVELLGRIGTLAATAPAGLVSLDLNPVVVGAPGQGCRVVDVAGIVEPEGAVPVDEPLVPTV